MQCVVRVRPILHWEVKQGDIGCVEASADGKRVLVRLGPMSTRSFNCRCLGNCTQAALFNLSGITSLLNRAMQGQGQTQGQEQGQGQGQGQRQGQGLGIARPPIASFHPGAAGTTTTGH